MRAQLILLGVIGVAFLGCSDDGDLAPPPLGGEGGAVVYEAGPRLAQCDLAALTPTQSAAKLTSAGVEVQRSSCGHITDMAYPAVCGAGTGEIILHDIPPSQLAAAGAAGFRSVEDLGGWQRASCVDYIHAIEVAQATTSCADIRNRVMLIRQPAGLPDHVMLLDQAGNCSDASYRQVLYGGKEGSTVLCSSADSIAGPQKICPVASHAATFETILANLQAPDLGLGAGFEVIQLYPFE